MIHQNNFKLTKKSTRDNKDFTEMTTKTAIVLNKYIIGFTRHMFSFIEASAPHAVPTLVFQGPSLYLKISVKKGHNTKILFSELCPLSCICILS